MIPKKIHYCWLSGGKIPPMLEKCMATWKEFLPDYEWILWDSNKFDINSVQFVKEAVSVKKWAFASDYIRLFAVYNEGGIYLDMDIIAKKGFDGFLKHDFFSAVEYFPYIRKKKSGIALQAAMFGAVAGHPFLKDCMDWYKNKHFIIGDKTLAEKTVAPDIYAAIAQKYGFEYKDEEQDLAENMKIYSSRSFASDIFTISKENYAVHCCAGSWREKSFLNKLITRNNFLRRLAGKPPKIDAEDRFDFVQNNPVWN